MIRIIKKKKEVKIMGRLKFKNMGTRGIRRVISISKIRKINLIKKKWILKGMWFMDIGSKPHSNGEIFSRERRVFFEIIKFNINKKIDNIRIIIIRIINWLIIYIKIDKFFNWKLNVISYTI